jgi:uncharacterized protein (TIGR00255 family)
MVQSMTGFGSAERNGCRVEIKSVNHRFLDIYVKAPSSLNQMEIPLRNMVKERFARGKFDITITMSELASAAVEINPEAVRKMYHAFKDLQGELCIKGEIDINTFIGLHEMFIETQQKYDLEEIATIFARALDDLAGMRSKEGETLAAELSRIALTVGASNEEIMASFDRVLSEIKDKFNEKLRTLLEGQDVEEGRILQEAAIFAAKLDIAEETARINSHLAQFREVLSGGGIIGRKLDFILQELNREVNTIASKSTDYGISGVTVEMKTAIEKMREQVQNLQ